MTADMSPKIIWLVMVAVVIFLVWGQSLFFDFVWDDGYLIVENPFIKNFRYIKNFFTGDVTSSTSLSHYASGYYRPLSMLWLMVDYRIWGLNPAGFHLTNLLIHFLNSCLVFFLAARLAKSDLVGLVAALFFAVHPVHTEAVVPIYNRMGIQATFFTLGSLLLFVNSRECRRLSFCLGGLGFFCLALLSKEEAVILPLVFWSYDYHVWSQGRLKNIFRPSKIFYYGACVFIWLAYFFIRHKTIAQGFIFPFFGLQNPQPFALAENFFFHALTSIKILSGYLTKIILPVRLSAVYWIEPVGQIADLGLWLSLAIIGGVIGLMGMAAKRSREAAFVIWLGFISLLPFSNLVPIGAAYTFHERFVYLASFSWCFFLGKFIVHLATAKDAKRSLIGKIILAGIMVFFITRAVFASVFWRDDLSLWQRTVILNPENQQAYLNLGEAYLRRGKKDEALGAFKESLRTRQRQALDTIYLTRINIANIYVAEGLYSQAMAELGEALSIAQEMKLNPFALYDKIGLVHALTNDWGKARMNFEQAVKLNPMFASGHYNLGTLYFEIKDWKMAESQFKKAWELDADFYPALLALGLTYQAQGKTAQARKAFENVLTIAPDDAQAKRQLSILE